jgi:carboxymethylenebutenolidase
MGVAGDRGPRSARVSRVVIAQRTNCLLALLAGEKLTVMAEASRGATNPERPDELSYEVVTLTVRGDAVPAMLFRPDGQGPFPGVVIGQEATGPNGFIRHVASDLARSGYVAIVPDYYHGGGPPDPENYEDIAAIFEHMAVLDFRHATYDLMEAVEYLKRLPEVDQTRLGVWGYCTGATMALLAACLHPELGATVLFYPSQPRFDALDAKRPIHPIDLVWNLTSPVLVMVGDQDSLWPPELVGELRERFDQWGIDATLTVYPGAGHAFCTPAPAFHHPEAGQAAWADGLRFLDEHLKVTAT